jgi:hypothetical protein
MTDSAPIAPSPNRLRRGRAMLALLTATAALSAGAQALAPAPALAMDNQGNECQNLPTWERSVCELENGGGSGAGGSGGAGGTNGDQGGQTIGHETIEVHDTRPSHCQLSPSSCLPSGGRPHPSSDGAGGLPHGRHGGRPVRVAEPKENEKTKEECALLHGKIAALEEAEKQAGLRADAARRHLRDARDLWILTVNERSRLAGEVDGLLRSWWPWKGKVRDLEKRYAEVQANIEDLERGMRLSSQDLDQARSARKVLTGRRLNDLYRFANGGCRWTD